MRLYTLKEFSKMKTTRGEVCGSATDILPRGSIVSLVLETREGSAPTGFYFPGGKYVSFTEVEVQGHIPNTACRAEELFFEIVDYVPPPKDRYVVKRVNWPVGIVMYPMHSDVKDITVRLKLKLSPALREHFVEEELYTPAREHKRRVRKLEKQLNKEEITLDVFEEQCKLSKQAYLELKESILAQLVAGGLKEVNCTMCDKERGLYCDHESAFLKIGDQITAKRKNVHLVKDDTAASLTVVEGGSLFTWNGCALDPYVLKYIAVGHVVRLSVKHSIGWSGMYVLVVETTGESCEGVILDIYLIMEFDIKLIGTHVKFQKKDIIEIPHQWPNNKNIELLVEKGIIDK
jgi:hypothetical protein